MNEKPLPHKNPGGGAGYCKGMLNKNQSDMFGAVRQVQGGRRAKGVFCRFSDGLIWHTAERLRLRYFKNMPPFAACRLKILAQIRPSL